MSKKNKNNSSWIFLIIILFLFLDLTLFNSGLIFLLILGIVFIYVGHRKIKKRLVGKLFFWLGVLFLVLTVINMYTFKLLLLGLFVYAIFQFLESRQKPTFYTPAFHNANLVNQNDEVVRKQPLLKNLFGGKQKTPESAYQWEDINIQTGIGDTIIDLSNTVLPKGESVIFIRGIAGTIKILAPYELEISVNHSAISGSVSVFNHEEGDLFNQSILYKTKNYDNASEKVKIVTSMIVGRLEVKRI